MAWITVKATQTGNLITFNTRNVSAVVENRGYCWIQLIGDSDRAVTVDGPREALVRKIIQAEWNERG